MHWEGVMVRRDMEVTEVVEDAMGGCYSHYVCEQLVWSVM